MEEKINLQRDGNHAKPYQVRQARAVILKYKLGGESLDEFLRQFFSVKREQAIAALDAARDSLLTGAHSS